MIKKLMSILGVVIFVLMCYSGIMLAWPHYKAWKYESDARDIIRFEIRYPHLMKEKLLKSGTDNGVPILENQVIVTQNYEGEYMAKIAWTEQVDLFGYYQKNYDFAFEVGGKELGTRR